MCAIRGRHGKLEPTTAVSEDNPWKSSKRRIRRRRSSRELENPRDERFKTMTVFVKKCLSKRRAIQKFCYFRSCPFRLSENGRHVLIKFNTHVTDKFGKKSVDTITAQLRKHHAADLSNFILTQRPLPIPIGCVLANSA